MSVLRLVCGSIASVIVIILESVSVACSCEDDGSKMGGTGSRLGWKDAKMRRGHSA
jgi:hypothetical protein